ncbi:hypothetical protein Fmac_026597 [Flemingia macrophylla]|uniref:Uncharacterized protein n=1 Tax=Flemingia macrophylla TaxID=520843 RepID=A0ABD1LFW3_9FABA
MDVPLPLDKLALDLIHNKPLQWKQKQLARDALSSDGFCVIGGYMSPVNDAYKKKNQNLEIWSRCRLCPTPLGNRYSLESLIRLALGIKVFFRKPFQA